MWWDKHLDSLAGQAGDLNKLGVGTKSSCSEKHLLATENKSIIFKCE